MDGAHDMGGVRGFGEVRPEADEPVFHAEWERREFAITLAMPGGWNLDMSRSARENRPAAEYLSLSYYEIWLAALQKLLLERGFVGADEIEAGHTLRPPKPGVQSFSPAQIREILAKGKPTAREPTTAACFAAGARVRARDLSPTTHTRLPRYVRGHAGVVESIHGCHVFPDSNALGEGENPQWLYTVCFDGRELWGAGSDATVKVSVDAWEPYLELA